MKVTVTANKDLHLTEFGVDMKEGEPIELDVNELQLQELKNTHSLEVSGGKKPKKKEKEDE